MARHLHRRSSGQRGGFKRVLDETLRRGLAAGDKPLAKPEQFVVKASSCGFLPGVDFFKFNQMLDDAETQDFIEHHAKDR
ncbi:MAG: hypothetical protein WCP55_24250 [Lentisphaerota bacterium]